MTNIGEKMVWEGDAGASSEPNGPSSRLTKGKRLILELVGPIPRNTQRVKRKRRQESMKIALAY